MSDPNSIHPSEDLLADYALDGRSEEIERHLQECSRCSRAVEEIKSLALEIARIPEEEIPSATTHSILSIPNRARRRKSRHESPWIRTVVTIGLGVAALVLFVYYFLIQLL